MSRLLDHAQSRARYRDVHLGLGATVVGECAFGSGVSIGRRTHVSDCTLESGVCVLDNCSLAGSRIANDVRIGPGAKVIGSTLGAHSIVHESCVLRDMVLEAHVAIWPRCHCNGTQVGAYSYVAPDSLLQHTITGRFCSIGPQFLCGYGMHPTDLVSTSPIFYATHTPCEISFAESDAFEGHAPITIGHDVWIGARVFVKDGVSIGDGAIVGAGAVVVKDVPNYAIVAGVPARVLRYRFTPEMVEQLLQMAWWNWDDEQLRRNQPWIAQRDIHQFVEQARRDSEQSHDMRQGENGAL